MKNLILALVVILGCLNVTAQENQNTDLLDTIASLTQEIYYEENDLACRELKNHLGPYFFKDDSSINALLSSILLDTLETRESKYSIGLFRASYCYSLTLSIYAYRESIKIAHLPQDDRLEAMLGKIEEGGDIALYNLVLLRECIRLRSDEWDIEYVWNKSKKSSINHMAMVEVLYHGPKPKVAEFIASNLKSVRRYEGPYELMIKSLSKFEFTQKQLKRIKKEEKYLKRKEKYELRDKVSRVFEANQ